MKGRMCCNAISNGGMEGRRTQGMNSVYLKSLEDCTARDLPSNDGVRGGITPDLVMDSKVAASPTV